MNVYARDELAPTLRALWRLLPEVVSGKFKPDSTRSGYLDALCDGLTSSLARRALVGAGSEVARDDVSQPTEDSSENSEELACLERPLAILVLVRYIFASVWLRSVRIIGLGFAAVGGQFAEGSSFCLKCFTRVKFEH
eukprot:3618159-Amphidinium_carterae.1